MSDLIGTFSYLFNNTYWHYTMHQARKVIGTGNTIANKRKLVLALIERGTKSQKCITTKSDKCSNSTKCSEIAQ